MSEKVLKIIKKPYVLCLLGWLISLLLVSFWDEYSQDTQSFLRNLKAIIFLLLFLSLPIFLLFLKFKALFWTLIFIVGMGVIWATGYSYVRLDDVVVNDEFAKELLSDGSTQQNTGSSMTDSREGTTPTTEDDNKQQEENTKE